MRNSRFVTSMLSALLCLSFAALAQAETLSPEQERTYQRLVNGQPFTFDDDSYMFTAGAALELLDGCSLPKEMSDRVELAEFVQGAALRAGIGPNYSADNIGDNMGAAMRGQAMMVAGALAVRSLGCVEPDASRLADGVVAVVRSNQASEEDGGATFTRGCQRQFSASQCECLASIGRGVFPNIYQMEYDRMIIAEIIQRNPLLGLTVAFQCGISNY